MKVTIERDALHAALGRVAKVIERRQTIPILSHVHMAADDGGLRLRGTDLDIEITTTAAASADEAGRATAPATRLNDVVANLPSGAQILIESDGATMTLKSGRSRTTLHTLPPQDFPEARAVAPSHTFEIAPENLMRLLGKTAFATCSEEARWWMHGTFLHALEVEGRFKLRAVTTDGVRLAMCECDGPDGSEGMGGITVPRKAIAELRRLAKDTESPIAVRIDDGRLEATIAAKTGPTILATKLIDGNFPDYQRVIPRDNDKHAAIGRAACIDAARRVACVSQGRDHAAKLVFADHALILSARSMDAGDAADEIAARYDAAPIEIGFNVAYLGEILDTLDGDDVRVEMADPGSPTLFRETDRDDLLLVLMPMRV